MKLYVTAPSPFARKCRIVAREKGLANRIEEIFVDPYASDPDLVSANPVVQVPALIADDGLPIIDSPAICEYLDEIGEGPRLIPAAGAERLRVRRIETLANAALEMGVKLLLENRRPESERSPSWSLRWRENMARTLDALEAADLDPESFEMGVLTTAVAVAWIGFRHPEFGWEQGRPSIVRLSETLEARPSFQATRPL